MLGVEHVYRKGQRRLKLKRSEARGYFLPKSDLPNRRVLLFEDLVPIAFEKLDNGLLDYLSKDGRVCFNRDINE